MAYGNPSAMNIGLLHPALQRGGLLGTTQQPAMVPGAQPRPMSTQQRPSMMQGLMNNPEALLALSGGLLAAGAPTTDPGRAQNVLGQTLQQTGGLLGQKAKERQQQEAMQGLLGSGDFSPQQQALLTAFPQIGAQAAVQSAFSPGERPGMVNMMNPQTQDVRTVPEGSQQQTELAQAGYALTGNVEPQKPAPEPRLATYYDTQTKQFVSVTPNDVMQGAGRYVPEQEAKRRGVGVQPNQPNTKQAMDRETGQTVFVTEQQIAGNPNRYGPVPSGMKMQADGNGGFTFASGGYANEPGTPLTASNETKQQDAFITAQDTLSTLDQMYASYDPRFSTTLGQLENSVYATLDRAGLNLDSGQAETLDKYTSWQRSVLENLSTTLNRLSGAAVSPDEYKRISSTLPNTEDSPREFQRKLADVRQNVMLSAMRAHYFMKNGIPANADGFANMSLDSMKGMLNERGNAIQQEVRAANPEQSEDWINKQVTSRLKTEFGVGV